MEGKDWRDQGEKGRAREGRTRIRKEGRERRGQEGKEGLSINLIVSLLTKKAGIYRTGSNTRIMHIICNNKNCSTMSCTIINVQQYNQFCATIFGR